MKVVQLSTRVQSALDRVSQKSRKIEHDLMVEQIEDFDFEMQKFGMPSYTQLVKSLKSAISSLDIVIRAYDKHVSVDNFAMMSRMDLADIQKKLGDELNNRSFGNFN